MVEMRLLPLRVLLHTRRIGDLQLAGQVVDDLGRHPFQRIRQEPADITSRGELDTETEPIVITPQPRHQSLAGVVQIEEPLQIGLRHRIAITPIGRCFQVTQEHHRHGPHRRTKPPQLNR